MENNKLFKDVIATYQQTIDDSTAKINYLSTINLDDENQVEMWQKLNDIKVPLSFMEELAYKFFPWAEKITAGSNDIRVSANNFTAYIPANKPTNKRICIYYSYGSLDVIRKYLSHNYEEEEKHISECNTVATLMEQNKIKELKCLLWPKFSSYRQFWAYKAIKPAQKMPTYWREEASRYQKVLDETKKNKQERYDELQKDLAAFKEKGLPELQAWVKDVYKLIDTDNKPFTGEIDF